MKEKTGTPRSTLAESAAGGRRRGFERASGLLEGRIRKVGEKRGFAVTRLLTHWPDIVGEDIARIARPVDVKYGREGFGATLSVLTTGAQAPVLEMQKEKLRDKVNACYGYAAISRIRITQTAPSGFAEGQAAFAPKPPDEPAPDPKVQAEAAELSADVHDPTLRAALEALGRNVLSRPKR
ncbi:hypothetical protein Ga0609869_001424 [Rhodovulum iodosum]|uniref:DUF721 domain-containing protein n=1 Tax=Rhodovulum iodosum TaxID=68291 RepID=A0ABV3XRW7_9RHOB|nr:DciA family protein [Rhodovulum robiginosum]RSK30413.1 DUF721 domain-containing protein [Rhodovulum robiginosum]